MADKNIRILSVDSSEPLTFAKVSELSSTDVVDGADYLLVSGYRDSSQEEVTRRINIADIFDYFIERYVPGDKALAWFVPVVNGAVISWQFKTIDEVPSIDPIDLISTIGDVTSEHSGLLSPSYKAVLDNLNPATTETDGLMSSTDKVKLNGIEASANNYSLPIASTSTLGGVKVDGTTISINGSGVITANSGAPDATAITIAVTDWDSQTHTTKVTMAVNTNKLNTVNVDASSLDEWVNCKVHAIAEDSTGITFACDRIPSSALSALVLSTTINLIV